MNPYREPRIATFVCTLCWKHVRLCFVLIEKCHLLADSISNNFTQRNDCGRCFFVDFDGSSLIAHMNQVQIHDSERGVRHD